MPKAYLEFRLYTPERLPRNFCNNIFAVMPCPAANVNEYIDGEARQVP
jgi:hypothetical protein